RVGSRNAAVRRADRRSRSHGRRQHTRTADAAGEGSRDDDPHGHARSARRRSRRPSVASRQRRAGGCPLRRCSGAAPMKFLPLLFANLRRKKIRTILTIGSFAVALFLFGLLGAIRYGFRQGIDIAGADRLVVIGRTSMIQPLPIPYYERLKHVAGVKDV